MQGLTVDSAPDCFGSLYDQLKLALLLIFGERVPFLGRSEPALGSYSELIEISEFRSFVISTLQIIELLEFTLLRGDEAR